MKKKMTKFSNCTIIKNKIEYIIYMVYKITKLRNVFLKLQNHLICKNIHYYKLLLFL